MTPLAYSIKSAAEATGLSASALDRAIRTGELKAKRTSKNEKTGEPTGKRVILASDLQAYLEGLVDG